MYLSDTCKVKKKLLKIGLLVEDIVISICMFPWMSQTLRQKWQCKQNLAS